MVRLDHLRDMSRNPPKEEEDCVTSQKNASVGGYCALDFVIEKL